MSNISKNEFIDKLNKFESHLPDEINTVYELSAVIGACNTAETSVKYDAPLQTVLYSTIDKPVDFIGESDSMLLLHFTTTNDNELEFDSAELRPFTESDIEKHPFYGKHHTDKTITQRTPEKDIDYLFESSYSSIKNLLVDWTDKATSIYDENPNWLEELDNIEQFGDMWIEIEHEIRNMLDDNYEGFVSLTIDGQPASELPEYIDIFEELIFEEQKEFNDVSSYGESVDIITGDEKYVLGISDVLPWEDYQSSKIKEEYPDLDPSKGWRHRPIDLTTGLLMKESQSVFTNLKYYMSIGDKNPVEYNYHLIPYKTGEYTLKELYYWWQDLKELQEYTGYEYLEFVFNIANPVETDNFDLFSESVNYEYDSIFTSLQKTGGNKEKELSVDIIKYNIIRELQQDINNSANCVDDVFNLYNDDFDGNELLSGDVESLHLGSSIFNPYWYANEMCGLETSIPSASSIEFIIPRAFLFGEKVDLHSILSSFIERQRHLLYEIDSYKDSHYYRYLETIAKQQIILRTLYDRDLIQTQRFNNEDNLHNSMNSDLFSESNVSNDAKYPYLLGNLVGRLSYTQYTNDVSQPAYMTYSVDYISKMNYQDVTKDVLNKIFQYTNKSNSSGYILEHYDDSQELQEALQDNPDPDDWDISENELQYYYSLGIVDGLTYSEEDFEE